MLHLKMQVKYAEDVCRIFGSTRYVVGNSTCLPENELGNGIGVDVGIMLCFLPL